MQKKRFTRNLQRSYVPISNTFPSSGVILFFCALTVFFSITVLCVMCYNFAQIQRTLQAIHSSSIPPTPRTADQINRTYLNPSTQEEFGHSLHTEPKTFFKKASILVLYFRVRDKHGIYHREYCYPEPLLSDGCYL